MAKLPSHLQRYLVEQDYAQYTPEEQAVWRFILRQLKALLSTRGHESYLEGLKKTGLHEDRIPNLVEMNQKLSALGWQAVAVSGFIPPSAFMELQALGFLPIAVEIRRRENILYTPAPDIVHEAAGHAPLLAHPDFSNYLKQYASTARSAIVSYEDLALYEAIRELSDIKEDPASTPELIQQHELKLQKAQKQITQLSEAQLLGRMNWWTVEYGLIGTLDKPRIFGAGLLSSILEARTCLDAKVKKIPLTLDCIQYDYNITEPQPQLFVASSFKHLEQVLNQMAHKMAFQRGGVYGVEQAIQARSINTVVLDSGAQISGQWARYIAKGEELVFIKTSSPTQLAFNDKQLPGHGVPAHKEGYSLPLGEFELWHSSDANNSATHHVPFDKSAKILSSIDVGAQVRLQYKSGLQLRGCIHKQSTQPVPVCTFNNCHIKYKNEVLFEPAWGLFDLLLGRKVLSVFGGAADREAFETGSFATHRVPPRAPRHQGVYDLYDAIYKYRRSQSIQTSAAPQRGQVQGGAARGGVAKGNELHSLTQEWLNNFSSHWLAGLELQELLEAEGEASACHDVTQQLKALRQSDALSKDEKLCLQMC